MRIYKATYSGEEILRLFTAVLRQVGRIPQGVVDDSLRHFIRIPSVERPSAEDELPQHDAQTPPVDVPRVSLTCEDFGRHVRHAARDAGVQSAFGVVYSHVEVCDVRVPLGVEKDVVRLEVAGGWIGAVEVRNWAHICGVRGDVPVNDSLTSQIVKP